MCIVSYKLTFVKKKYYQYVMQSDCVSGSLKRCSRYCKGCCSTQMLYFHKINRVNYNFIGWSSMVSSFVFQQDILN